MAPLSRFAPRNIPRAPLPTDPPQGAAQEVAGEDDLGAGAEDDLGAGISDENTLDENISEEDPNRLTLDIPGLQTPVARIAPVEAAPPDLLDSVHEEIAAGKQALGLASARHAREHEYGQKMLELHARRHARRADLEVDNSGE